MGYERALWIPVIVIIGIMVIKNTKRTGLRIFNTVLVLIFLFGYCFIYPGLFGIKNKSPYIYWTGGKRESGKLKDSFEKKRDSFLEKLGFEFIGDDEDGTDSF